MIAQILEMVLPVLLMLLIGYYCNKKQIFTMDGLQGLKSIVSDICLPVVLFNAFFMAEYSLRLVLVFAVVYTGYILALLGGYATRKLCSPYGRLSPLLMTACEGGMLGYALYGVLVGNQSEFATVDIGNTFFAYTIYLAAMKASSGEKLTPKFMVTNMLTNKCCMGMLLGIVLGAAGVGDLVRNSAIGGTVSGVISMITAPTSAIVLITVGYELNLEKNLLKPVMKSTLIRLVIQAGVCVLASLAIFTLVPFDKNLMIALMILFALPAPFIIPMFADVKEDGKYISTALSVYTLLTVGLYALISIYALM